MSPFVQMGIRAFRQHFVLLNGITIYGTQIASGCLCKAAVMVSALQLIGTMP